MKSRLWELDGYHCSIIGTCLNLRELQKISRQTKLELAQNISEFELHGTIVSLSSSKGLVSKAVEKMLNKKYAVTIRKFAQIHDESSLVKAWKEAISQGDVPGPYWALLTHPLASTKTKNLVFGDVHMLSHLVGSANRADIKALSTLQSRLENMEDRYANMKKNYKLRLKEIGLANTEKRKKIKRMALELVSLRNFTKQDATLNLQEENQTMQKSLGTMSAYLLEIENSKIGLEARVAEQEKLIANLERELREKDQEIHLLEQELENSIQPLSTCMSECDMAGTPECPGPLLCGKKILYVGGRTNLVHHYRSLVERHGAEFIHHDGGIEDTKNSLPKLLNSVDSVICPIDCVSHNACLLVKDACKQRVKPLKFIRSSGLSSLARSLAELGEAANEGTLYS